MYDILKDKNALYIEDEQDVLTNISKLLKKFFNNFYTAGSAEEALEIFEDNKIDLLLVDIELPKMNGIDFIREIRKKAKTIPIVVISAYTKTDYLLQSIELNLDKYIVKPLTSRKIHTLLETLNRDFLEDGSFELASGVIVNKLIGNITFDDKSFELTKKEIEFLEILHLKKLITYDELYALWRDDVPSDNAVRSFIKYLRKKVPEDFIKNRSGIGYYIDSN
jgi:DNA-binding response OmpR family regulator